MPVADRITLRCEDDEGLKGTTGFWTQSTINRATWEADYLALLNAIDAVSEAGFLPSATFVGSTPYVPSDLGPYSTIEDKLELQLRCADGSDTSMELPCPVSTIFEADERTVDPSDALIIELIAQLVTLAANKFASAIVGLVFGRRVQRERGRK